MGANVYGRDNNEVQVIGSGYTTLEDLLKQVAAQQGRTIVPEGLLLPFRSVQFCEEGSTRSLRREHNGGRQP